MSSYRTITSKAAKSPRFKYYSIVVGLLLGYILFKLTSWTSTTNSRALTNFYRFNPRSRGANPYSSLVTNDRLARFFPYDDTPKRIDRNIYQMWKVRVTDPDFPHKDLIAKWKNENPTYKYNLLTDDEIHNVLETHFSNTVPEVVEAFDMMPNKIIQSDFSRYLLIFLYGGIYADIDTDLEKPVDTWFDSDRNVGFVVGVEEDMNVENWEHYMTRRIQFEQWTFKSKARHPILRKLIAKIVETTFNAKKNDKLQAYYKDFKGVDKCDSIDIMEWTGPVVWTDTIYGYLNSLENPTVVDVDSTRDIVGELFGPESTKDQLISWKFFTGLKAPVMVDDVVIYPRLSFREDPENNCGKYCYVHHQFGGSWKNNGKGEIKPGMEGYEDAGEDNTPEVKKRDVLSFDSLDSGKKLLKRDVLSFDSLDSGKKLLKRDCAFPYHPY